MKLGENFFEILLVLRAARKKMGEDSSLVFLFLAKEGQAPHGTPPLAVGEGLALLFLVEEGRAPHGTPELSC